MMHLNENKEAHTIGPVALVIKGRIVKGGGGTHSAKAPTHSQVMSKKGGVLL